ncbi:SDR family oxidoreductase [Microbacterium terricola]|uniref:2-dehydro-3-deoxy-D-gluconate 5-dehydrogenase n=1 Tax=Microbacterium terricola TaxID=344163 RepID=A0ABM8DWE3_9MICO|nr:SDR family oxidoreductase [Microbacterium terricola]UYK39379.1 SDR family oxidoreductase [Microbacterium terricola]BDV29897.1 2-dehydro-3-deoxy-D-gluconate 5-dehydrogenase [Microbacterium terricola]
MSAADLFSLSGRTALVTGAGRGIGREIARALADAGADLVLVGRAESLASAADELAATGRRVDVVTADLGDAAALPARMDEVAGSHAVDILVNCAGIIRRGAFLDAPDADWHEVLTVNLEAPRILSRAFAAGMLERGRGKIINIASLLSFQGGKEVAGYTASKHALVGLTHALANEWAGRGVQVNAIAPGYIATDNTAALRSDPTRDAEILSRIPAGRWGTPSDLAGAAIFLASPASDYVTGHTLVVDGGWMSR